MKEGGILNERVKELRDFLGLTMEKFGERVGVKKSAINKIEKGNNSVTDQMIKSICREFGVSEEWLRTGEGEMLIPVTQNQKISRFVAESMKTNNQFVLNTIEAMSQLSPEELKTIEKFVNTISTN